ncbi:hypothetical protein D9758_010049 [Tetrapyrgos nigripes]|uniref:Uncharacterized protein n=1 Tax=Tetrapyrgos nigripes TaxID=182062 RepID=A0A8H5CU67_9AGAR|nr:hypothetical protein D9758_010049 [Tetrapyrgos nigripes]
MKLGTQELDLDLSICSTRALEHIGNRAVYGGMRFLNATRATIFTCNERRMMINVVDMHASEACDTPPRSLSEMGSVNSENHQKRVPVENSKQRARLGWDSVNGPIQDNS